MIVSTLQAALFVKGAYPGPIHGRVTPELMASASEVATKIMNEQYPSESLAQGLRYRTSAMHEAPQE